MEVELADSDEKGWVPIALGSPNAPGVRPEDVWNARQPAMLLELLLFDSVSLASMPELHKLDLVSAVNKLGTIKALQHF
jgi:hypothetical protein